MNVSNPYIEAECVKCAGTGIEPHDHYFPYRSKDDPPDKQYHPTSVELYCFRCQQANTCATCDGLGKTLTESGRHVVEFLQLVFSKWRIVPAILVLCLTAGSSSMSKNAREIDDGDVFTTPILKAPLCESRLPAYTFYDPAPKDSEFVHWEPPFPMLLTTSTYRYSPGFSIKSSCRFNQLHNDFMHRLHNKDWRPQEVRITWKDCGDGSQILVGEVE